MGFTMKKFTVVIALLLALVMVLSACAGKTDPPANSANSANSPNSSNSTPAGNSGSQGTTPANSNANTQPANSNANTQPNADTQPANTSGNTQPNGNPEPAKPAFNQNDLMDKIPFSVNDHVGWEFRDVTVNGEFRRISVQYEMDKADLELDRTFIYYYITIHGDGTTAMESQLVAVGRVLLDDWTKDVLKEEIASDEFLGIEDVFWLDFQGAAFKGKDTEYIVFKIPAGWEENTSSMIITTADAILLADVVVDKSYQVALSGDDPEKYQDYNGNTNFFSFSKDSITYLKVSRTADGITYLTEYALEINNNQITSVETGRTYQTADTVPELTGLHIY